MTLGQKGRQTLAAKVHWDDIELPAALHRRAALVSNEVLCIFISFEVDGVPHLRSPAPFVPIHLL